MAIKHFQKADKTEFIDEETIRAVLDEMEANILLNTPNEVIKDREGFSWSVSFCEKHIAYLKTHPKLDPETYLANVRTMARIRH